MTFIAKPQCGNNIRNGVWREYSRKNEMRKKALLSVYVEAMVTIQKQLVAEVCTIFI